MHTAYFKKIVSKGALFLLMLLCLVNATAQTSIGIDETIHSFPFKGTADVAGVSNALSVNPAFFSAADYNSVSVQSTQHRKEIKNVITFSVIEETPLFIPQDFTATVTLIIEYGHSISSLNSLEKTFTVDYKKEEGAKYNAKQYFTFDGAEYVRIAIKNMNAPVVGSLDTRDILMVENKMQITRHFELPATVPAPSSLGPGTLTGSVPDHLPVSWSWPLNTGNNATQLEWAWIENEMLPNYLTGGTLDYNLVFKNASRVDLPYEAAGYDIPLLYDGVGNLYYRIRAVNIKVGGGRSDGPWTVASAFPFGGHNPDLNWQATTSFAEEGKRKSVVQYFDGSLRGRQTVTKDNSNNTTVTAETFYDGQGRPAIQILPVPGRSGIDNVIKYQQNLNLFNSQVANQDPSEIFDMQPMLTPNSLTPPLNTASGTSQYYSAANPDINEEANKNIPDAEGYPYTVTRYTPDATGRILSQSGVGAAHKMGTGHETKYYYGGASQEELDGLFGTEAGYFTHYFKNMVKDANGQMSISYTDMHGRTVATALAGDAPGALQALDIDNPAHYPNQQGSIITRNLLDNTTNVVQGNTIESINSILVPALTNYEFTYELSPQSLSVDACPGTTPAVLCYDCLYDLEITINEESGEQQPIIRKFSNVSLTVPADDNCATPVPPFKDLPTGTSTNNIITFLQQLQPGSYSVRKTLSVSESSLQHYKDLYLPKAMCKTEQELIDSVYNVLLTTSGCGTGNPTEVTCAGCNAQLGTKEQFTTAYLTGLGITTISPQLQNEIDAAYAQAKRNCDLLCNNISQSLPTIREMMLADMIPYTGQYATKDATDHILGTDQSMFNKYNIFSTAGNPSDPQPFYKYPKAVAPLTGIVSAGFYKDDLGNTDLTIHPDIPASYVFLNGRSPAEFEALFHTSWAEALLPHHPEYQRLVFAESLQSSYNWINTFSQTEHCPATVTDPYFDPVASAVNADPFFQAAPSYASQMTAAIGNYKGMNVSMWQLAYGEVRCKSIQDVGTRQACYQDVSHNGAQMFFNSGFTQAEKDQAWQLFQGLYAAQRNEYVNEFIANQRPLSGGTTEENALISQHFTIWFPRSNAQVAAQSDWPWWTDDINTPPGIPTGGPVSPSGSYDGKCTSYITTWKARLLQCNALATMQEPEKTAVLTEITDRMKAVCVRGSDAANPNGSSNVAPSTPASVTDRSFEDVIRNVFIQHGILNADGIYRDNFCNPFVIDWPKPYGKSPQLIAAPPAIQIDGCNCEQYAAVKNDAVAHNIDVTNLTAFNQYLLATHGDVLTPAMFTALEEHCGGGGTNTACVCSNLDQIKDLFLILYPDGSANQCPVVPVDLSVSLRTGNHPDKYVASNSITFNPGFESGTADEFEAYISTGSICDPATACQDNFTAFFNAHYGAGTGSYTWSQIAALYLESCGKELDVCDVKEAKKLAAKSKNKVAPPQQKLGGGPKNDNLCNAIELTPATECFFTTFSNTDASAEENIPAPSCGYFDDSGENGNDVWFKVTVPTDAPLLIIDTKDLGLSDGIMAVYTASGTCPSLSLTEVACSDDVHASMPEISLSNVTAGTTYYIRVWGWPGYTGDFGICVKTPLTPENDDCDHAISLSINTDLTCTKASTGTLEAATPSSVPAASCSSEDQVNDVWYNFTASASAHIVSVSGYTPMSLAVYTGECNSLTEIACSVNHMLQLSDLTIGSTYYVRISGTTSPEFTVCVRTIPPQANCSITIAPYILPSPQPMPNFLVCGYTPSAHCISCAGLSTLTGEFKTKFAAAINTAPIFTNTNLTNDQVQYNMNFARFINYRTGFQFNWLDYSKAAEQATPGCNLNNYATNTGATQNVICGTTKPLTEYIPPTVDPCEAVHTMAVEIGQHIYHVQQQYMLAAFEAAYKAKCLGAKDIEKFSMKYKTSEYHYTLYYYDLGGNLVKTVPPKGVHPDFSETFTNNVKASRNSGDYILNPIRPPHTFVTDYRFNSLGQVTAQHTPDAENFNFWYDALGRLVVSQNAQQQLDNKYSYTLYDPLGRITEVGQKPQAAASMQQSVSQDIGALNTWINVNGGVKEQITATVYDQPLVPLVGDPTVIVQQNLRNRVSYAYTKKLDTDDKPAAATYYTYDVHGNVDKLVQDYYDATLGIAGNNSRYKLMMYDYDLISGKVNKVSYQPGYADAFYHRYSYDAENRITSVETSRDQIVWERDAAYSYYKHGPLQRTVLGKLQVQGMDYSYTIQGWMKGINNTALGSTGNFTGDGNNGSVVAKDILSYGLHYFDETVNGNVFKDYKPIGGTNAFAAPGAGSNMLSLYNGNIAGMSVNNAGLLKADPATYNTMALFSRYRYDQLNRIVAMQAYKGLDVAANQWTAVAMDDYKEAISYDPNGNILTYNRKGAPSAGMQPEMDDLTYGYYGSTNRLRHVSDPTPDNNYTQANGTEDIDNQANPDNYTYDAIGSMKTDLGEKITNIDWNAYGKILSVTKNGNTIKYDYDPAGNRIAKTAAGKKTLYARDGSGNTMSVYESLADAEPLQKEIHLYGSSRLGMNTQLTTAPMPELMETGFEGTLSTFTRGEKIFELSNHLGNVLTTISDKKIQHQSAANNNLWDYYTTDVLSATDYYPFGMQMPARKYTAVGTYRYGFNGKENDNEVKGEGNQQDYGMRAYDPRLGRFLSNDPLSKKFPMLTPFQYSSNSPILYIDIDGAEGGRYAAPSWSTVLLPTNAIVLASFEKTESRQLMGFDKMVNVHVGELSAFQLGNEIFTPRWSSKTGKFSGYYSGFSNKYDPYIQPNIGLVLAFDQYIQTDSHLPASPNYDKTWNLPFDFNYSRSISSLSPDAITVSVGAAATGFTTGEGSLNETKILTGPHAQPFSYYSYSGAFGYSTLEAEVSVNASIGFSWALNGDFTRDLIPGPSTSYNIEVGLKDALDLSGTISLELGYSGSILDKRSDITSATLKIGVEAGAGIGTNVAGGVTWGTTSETWTITDAFKPKE